MCVHSQDLNKFNSDSHISHYVLNLGPFISSFHIYSISSGRPRPVGYDLLWYTISFNSFSFSFIQKLLKILLISLITHMTSSRHLQRYKHDILFCFCWMWNISTNSPKVNFGHLNGPEINAVIWRCNVNHVLYIGQCFEIVSRLWKVFWHRFAPCKIHCH